MGSVSTYTTGEEWSAKVPLWLSGTEIVNGSEGAVNSIEVGSGVENVAEALTRSRSMSEKMWKVFSVTNCENEGKGVLFPESGRPGICGTRNY